MGECVFCNSIHADIERISKRRLFPFVYRKCAVFSPTTFAIVAIEDFEIAGSIFALVGVSVTFVIVGLSLTLAAVDVVGAAEQEKHRISCLLKLKMC